MKSLSYLAFGLLPIIAACSSVPVAKNAAELNVGIEWTAQSGCSAVSPPIKLNNVPKETKFIDVYMIDLNFSAGRHGGGMVAYDGSGMIKEGALKSYNGPCPRDGQHSYQFTIDALNADKSMIVGQGKTTIKYPK